MGHSTLKVGAGKSAIKYTSDMFPNFRENYTHVHDDSYTQVLIMESDFKYVFVACGTVMVPEVQEVKNTLSGMLGVSIQNIIVHGKHVLSAPHCGRSTVERFMEHAAHFGKSLSIEEAEIYVTRDNMLTDAVHESIYQAAKIANESIREARIGFVCGYTDVNVNRVVHTDKGWWQGHNPDGVTDRTLPVLRFDDMDGTPIAILFNCNTAPGVLENSFLSDGRRAASGDLAAAAEKFVEDAYGGETVAIYTTGATGDQWQSLRSLFDRVGKNGKQTTTDLREQGFLLVDILGTRLGEQVVRMAEQITTDAAEKKISLNSVIFKYPGQRATVREDAGAVTECQFLPDGEREAGVSVLRIGDLAIVFCGVEMGVRTYNAVKLASPFKNTFVVEFANEAGGGYMVEQDLYEKMSYQSRKSRFAAGAAERFKDDVIKFLNEIYSE